MSSSSTTCTEAGASSAFSTFFEVVTLIGFSVNACSASNAFTVVVCPAVTTTPVSVVFCQPVDEKETE